MEKRTIIDVVDLRRYNLGGVKKKLVWTSQNEARTKIESEENRKSQTTMQNPRSKRSLLGGCGRLYTESRAGAECPVANHRALPTRPVDAAHRTITVLITL